MLQSADKHPPNDTNYTMIPPMKTKAKLKHKLKIHMRPTIHLLKYLTTGKGHQILLEANKGDNHKLHTM